MVAFSLRPCLTAATSFLLLAIVFRVRRIGWPGTSTKDFARARETSDRALSQTGRRSVKHSSTPQCPADCRDVFNKLEDAPSGSGEVQDIEIQMRGEPKSGTGMTQERAWAALVLTCEYLQTLYGEKTCRIVEKTEEEQKSFKGTYKSIVFEPRLANEGGEGGPCTCDSVESHCGWAHPPGIPHIGDTVCTSPHGLPIADRADLWMCVEDNDCTLTDKRHQLVVIRDPRAVTVSAYFMRVKEQMEHGPEPQRYLDEYFQSMLGVITMWTSVRYLLFMHLIAEQSLVLFYEDAMADPLDWYTRYYDFIGVNMPLIKIEEVALATTEEVSIMGLHAKGFDKHPGSKSEDRTFRHELNETSLAMMDDVLRQWLPVPLMDKYLSSAY